MGTNYYWNSKPCPTCGYTEKQLHIGKSSYGWYFALHVYPGEENKPQNLEDWRKLFKTKGSFITDEYGDKVTVKEMISTITKRTKPEPLPEELSEILKNRKAYYGSVEEFLEANTAVIGEHNLLRSRIDNRFCIGHGDSTYDLIVGDFS